jgi:hypothetical protein
VVYIRKWPGMETQDAARLVASPVLTRQRQAQRKGATPYTRAPTSSPTGGTKKPHKFFLALGLPGGDWADKDKRDKYRLAIDKALDEARNLTKIDLKHSWRSYAVELREEFVDEFKRRLEQYLRYR